jgi:hypothetical protein
LDDDLKKRVGANYTIVRKAWLELGAGSNGTLSPLELANFLGAGGQKNFDYNLLEILVKMKTSD